MKDDLRNLLLKLQDNNAIDGNIPSGTNLENRNYIQRKYGENAGTIYVARYTVEQGQGVT